MFHIFFPMTITFFYSSFFFILSFILLSKDTLIQILIPLSSLNSIDLSLGLILDWMSILFSASVLFISSMIMMFSQSYM